MSVVDNKDINPNRLDATSELIALPYDIYHYCIKQAIEKYARQQAEGERKENEPASKAEAKRDKIENKDASL